MAEDRQETDPLEARVREALAARGPELGLDPSRVRLTYVLNMGGFVNRSYHVTDGARRLHLKLAGEPAQVGKLARWRSVRGLLELRYRAPAMVGWLEVPGTSLQGPLFEFLAGASPERLTPGLRAQLAPVLARLHGDREVAGRLGAEAAAVPCRDAFLNHFVRRLRADLRTIGSDRPAFLAESTLDWMSRETAALEAWVSSSAAFSASVRSAVHGDLWLDNLRVEEDGRCRILDWDDLRLGDPALDWATLLGPASGDLTPARVDDLPDAVAADPGLRERLPLYARASLLDWVVDPLADYVDADAAPLHAAEVRAEKRRVHEAALALYRELYPSPPR